MTALTHAGSTPLSRDQARAVFGQVMGLVALAWAPRNDALARAHGSGDQ